MYKRQKCIHCPDYQIDTNGIVYSKKGKPLKASVNPKGYLIVVFSINGKRKAFSVHRLVADQFISVVDGSMFQVNHKDGNKQNNNVDNLEWVTQSGNMWHAANVINTISRKSPVNTRSICGIQNGEIIYQFKSIADGARYFHLNYGSFANYLYRQMNGQRKHYKNCIWKYLDDIARYTQEAEEVKLEP